MKKTMLTLFIVLFFAAAAMAQVNINTATVDELTSLPGIGTKKAQAIEAYRKKNGNFHSVEDLSKVKGIGDKMVTKLKPEATTGK